MTTFKNIRVSIRVTERRARRMVGLRWNEAQFWCEKQGKTYVGETDCLRLPLLVFREVGLWPDEWGGVLPKSLREPRFYEGNQIKNLGDFPEILEFLGANFKPIKPEKARDGDLVLFDVLGQGAAHHCAFLFGDELIHATQTAGVCVHAYDDFWRARAVGAWRLKAYKRFTRREKWEPLGALSERLV